MRRNATLARPTAPADLTPAQLAALGALLAGQSVTAAAGAASVDRATLYRWLKDPAFAATYNHGRADLWAATENRLLSLADRATAVVESAIDNVGDVKVALAVLRGLGLLGGSPPVFGPDTAVGVEDEQVAARLKVGDRALNRALAGGMDGLGY